MARDNAKPEGPADVGEPADEGGKVKPDEHPSRRNMSDRLPGEANEGDESEQERAQTKQKVRQKAESDGSR